VRTFIAFNSAGEEMNRSDLPSLLHHLGEKVSGHGATEKVTILIMLPSGIQWNDLEAEEKNKIFRQMDLRDRIKFNEGIKGRVHAKYVTDKLDKQ